MKKPKVAILGTRGIPNNYGGFEQFAEYLSKGLAKEGLEVYVYNPHNHPYREKRWQGVNIIRQYDPEYKIGTAGQFIYDFNCIRDSRKKDFDVVLILGYTSSSIWFWMYPRSSSIFTNMDGLEWKRSKYSGPVKWFLQKAEWLGAKYGGQLIADSPGIKKHLKREHGLSSTYIPYGAEEFDQPDKEILKSYNLSPYSYNMLIARLEPENNIETILKGIVQSETDNEMIVVGNTDNSFAYKMKQNYESDKIVFTEGIYDIQHLNNLRYFSNLYFHGHSVGGTNPSLLEAMASKALIVAHNNTFNKDILGEEAFYFNNDEELTHLIKRGIKKKNYLGYLEKNITKIKKEYNWPRIIKQYKDLMISELLN